MDAQLAREIIRNNVNNAEDYSAFDRAVATLLIELLPERKPAGRKKLQLLCPRCGELHGAREMRKCTGRKEETK